MKTFKSPFHTSLVLACLPQCLIASSRYVWKTSKNFFLPLAIYVLKTLRKEWCLMFNNSAWIGISWGFFVGFLNTCKRVPQRFSQFNDYFVCFGPCDFHVRFLCQQAFWTLCISSLLHNTQGFISLHILQQFPFSRLNNHSLVLSPPLKPSDSL